MCCYMFREPTEKFLAVGNSKHFKRCSTYKVWFVMSIKGLIDSFIRNNFHSLDYLLLKLNITSLCFRQKLHYNYSLIFPYMHHYQHLAVPHFSSSLLQAYYGRCSWRRHDCQYRYNNICVQLLFSVLFFFCFTTPSVTRGIWSHEC